MMFDPDAYTIATAIVFPRLLGFIYFFAFGAFLFQIKGLIGENGILPIGTFLDWVKKAYPKNYFSIIPSVFWLNHSNTALLSVVATGTVLSVLLMIGVYPPLLLFLLYILYLSIVSAGQEFLGFGWEGFLLEITFNAFFLTLMTPSNFLIWISLNLVLFRFHLQGGAVKLQSRDPNWKNLTAIAFHYQSQPIPNTQAWYAHKLPMWFQKFSTVLMFFIELVVPFAFFGTDLMRLYAFFALVGLQLMIWFTGNFSFLNHLTVVLCTILVSNAYFGSFIEAPVTASHPFLDVLCTGVGLFLIALQLGLLWNHFYPNTLLNRLVSYCSNFYIANRYGIFAVITTTRIEIVIEGSEDGVEWKEYLFYHKPSEVTRRPRRISPYQPRIDWQAWFLPFGHRRHEAWFQNFLNRLLKGTPEVLALLRENPFKDKPPKFIRALAYDYTFTSFAEKKATGRWWNRQYVGLFSNPVTLNQ